MSKDSGVTPRAAATLLMCRDTDEGIETFMVVRHHQIDFASGALVFPGGKADEEDYDARLRGHCDGAEVLNDEELALRVAGIREAFEESGILYARRRGESGLITGAELEGLESYREPLKADETAMIDMVDSEGLVLACDCLEPFAHWVTPKFMPKRFDTHFFVARAPEDHVGSHDGSESVDSVWITPERLLRESEDGKWTVIFPTRCNIMLLGESGSVDEAMERSRARDIVTVEPWLEQDNGAQFICIPPEAGYSLTKVPAERP